MVPKSFFTFPAGTLRIQNDKENGGGDLDPRLATYLNYLPISLQGLQSERKFTISSSFPKTHQIFCEGERITNSYQCFIFFLHNFPKDILRNDYNDSTFITFKYAVELPLFFYFFYMTSMYFPLHLSIKRQKKKRPVQSITNPSSPLDQQIIHLHSVQRHVPSCTFVAFKNPFMPIL